MADAEKAVAEAEASVSEEFDLSSLGAPVLPEPERVVEVDLGLDDSTDSGDDSDPDTDDDSDSDTDIDVGDKSTDDDEGKPGDKQDSGDEGGPDDSKDGDDQEVPEEGDAEAGQGDDTSTGDKPKGEDGEGGVSDSDTDEPKLEEDLNPDNIKVTLGEDEEVTVTELMDEVESLRKFKTGQDGDKFLSDLIKYYNETGDLAPYLESQTVDYKQMSDLELMRQASFKSNGSLEQRFKDEIFKNEMLDKYGFDTDSGKYIADEDDPRINPELNEAKLKRDAALVRSERVKAQEDFKVPEKQERTDPLAEQREEEAKRVANWIKTVDKDPNTKSLLETGKLKIGTKSGNFGYEPKDRKGIVEMTKDQSKFFENFNNKGEVNTELWQEVAAYAQDADAFKEALITYGKTLATEESLKEKKNIGDRTKHRQGVATPESGDAVTNFLMAALKQKKG